MKTRIKLFVVLLFILGVGGLFSARVENAAKESSVQADLFDNAALALRRPDEFSWALFTLISKRSAENRPVQLPNGSLVTTNNAAWETWADDQFTFPSAPDPADPPKWERRNEQPKRLTDVFQQQLKILGAKKKLTNFKGIKEILAKDANKLMTIAVGAGGTQEVRRNQAAFDFIIANDLWYLEGLKCAFTKGNPNSRPNGKLIDFPPNAVEIKATWKTIAEKEKPNYHWNYDGNGRLFGLTGLHVVSKAIPNWTWATFEWVGNPGRCDYIGCHDSFGITPAVVAPMNVNGKLAGTVYPAGTMTPGVLKMFRDAGYDEQWIAEWQNYRLRGSQIDFTTPSGVTTLLGNSTLEDGFVRTSSCMTCHANAAIDSEGLPNPTFGFAPDRQSLNGPVLPQWLYDLNTWDPALLNFRTKYYQTDFVWAIFSAQNVAAGKPIPPCSES